MIVDTNFLNEVAKRKKHTFISTGMSTIDDIESAVKIFRKNNCPFELMHCVSTYPMKPEDANLKTILALKEKFDCEVGYSGHENGVAVSLAAAFFNLSSLIFFPTSGLGSTFQSPVWNIVPDGVVIFKPFGSIIECVNVTKSILKGSRLIVPFSSIIFR